MLQIRQGVFETNSSSTHAISVCLAKDYDDLKAGKAWLNRDLNILPIDEAMAKNEELCKYAISHNLDVEDHLDWEGYKSYDDMYSESSYEWYSNRSTLNGVEVVAFGYYGYDY